MTLLVGDVTSQCRLRVWFEGFDPLDYRADSAVAHEFAMAAHTVGAVVTIDEEVSDDLRPLPCERLWHS
ncbi:MAG: hypothetical protein HOQ24_03420 [Mycobacteriaceae bacterium]|nr:hypothetical protein [Mycobacteriaceae bacterium]